MSAPCWIMFCAVVWPLTLVEKSFVKVPFWLFSFQPMTWTWVPFCWL